jgi:hypothetical protein
VFAVVPKHFIDWGVQLVSGQLHLPLPIITTTAVLDLGIDFLDDLVVDRFSNIRVARTLVPTAAA